MVSGTLKIRQNHWRVVQNQGSLKNVKMSSEVAFLVDFGPFLETLLAPKVIFCQKKRLRKMGQKKAPPKWETGPGGRYGQTGWLPERPPLASKSF